MRTFRIGLILCAFAINSLAQVSVLPRIGHDFIIGTGNNAFARSGRYIFEKTNQGDLQTPRNWYLGLGLETYNASTPLRFAFDVLLIDRTIDQQISSNTNTFNARALKGKALFKYVFGDFETSHHFFLGGGAAYATNLNEKYYENGTLRNSPTQKFTSGGATAIVGLGYEWQPSSSSVSSNDAVIEVGVYYNRDFFPFVKAYPDTKLSYLNVGLNLSGVFSLLMKNPNR